MLLLIFSYFPFAAAVVVFRACVIACDCHGVPVTSDRCVLSFVKSSLTNNTTQTAIVIDTVEHKFEAMLIQFFSAALRKRFYRSPPRSISGLAEKRAIRFTFLTYKFVEIETSHSPLMAS